MRCGKFVCLVMLENCDAESKCDLGEDKTFKKVFRHYTSIFGSFSLYMMVKHIANLQFNDGTAVQVNEF